MPFSDVLNEVKAPVGPATVRQSTIGGLADLASGLVGQFKDLRKNSITEQATQEMSALEGKLRTAMKQGTIDQAEYLQRLNAKQQEITANFPSVATDIRANIQTTLGVLPSQAVVADAIKENDRIKAQSDLMVNEGIKSGFAVMNKDGTINREVTVNNWMEVKQINEALDVKIKQLTIAKSTEGTPLTFAEKDKMLGSSLSQWVEGLKQTYTRPNLLQVEQVLRATNDPKAYGEALDLYNMTTKQQYDAVSQKVHSSGVSNSEADGILSRLQTEIDKQREWFFTGDFSLAKNRLGVANKILENSDINFKSNFSDYMTMTKNGGPNIDLLISSTVGGKGMVQKMSDTLAGTVIAPDVHREDISQTVINGQPASNLPLERQAALLTTLSEALPKYAVRENLTDLDKRTMAGGVTAMVDIAKEHGSKKDITATLANLDSPALYSRILELNNPKHPFHDFGAAAAQSITGLSSKTLIDIKPQASNELASAMFNPVKGVFEVVQNNTAVSKLRKDGGYGSINQQNLKWHLNQVQPTVDTLNHALNLISAVQLTQGTGKAHDAEVRQQIADQAGYETNPLYRKREVSDDTKEALQGVVNRSGATPAGTDGWTVTVEGD